MSAHTLMFGWEYPPLHTGGLGVACQGLVRGLTKNGVKVTLVLPMDLQNHPEAHMLRGPSDATGTIELDEATVRFIQSELQPYEGFAEYAARMQSIGINNVAAPGQSIADLYGPDLGAAVWRYAEQAVSMTKDLHPDVVHCHDWMTYEAGIRASKYHRVPMVAHIHATELDRTHMQPNTWIADQERNGFLMADQIIAVSNYTKNVLVQHYGINPHKISVVYNGHDAPRPNLHLEHKNVIVDTTKKHTPLVLFLGRMTTQKNPAMFLEVAKLVTNELPAVQFVMAGDGGMLTELVDRACAMGLSENVIFTGKVGKREAEQLYRHADCFVMPSVSEPFGLVALEAIAHGTPVILSKQSGAAEVCDHAFKVDFWDKTKMADCIVTVLREEPLARQLRSEAPSILKRLNWKHQAGEVASIYKHILSSR